MRHFLLLLFLITIVNPYDSISCYECITVYDLKEDLPYQIKVYEPEKNENEVEYTDAEINRFIKKATSIINYSPYVFE